jgi:hypothetical protein
MKYGLGLIVFVFFSFFVVFQDCVTQTNRRLGPPIRATIQTAQHICLGRYVGDALTRAHANTKISYPISQGYSAYIAVNSTKPSCSTLDQEHIASGSIDPVLS